MVTEVRGYAGKVNAKTRPPETRAAPQSPPARTRSSARHGSSQAPSPIPSEFPSPKFIWPSPRVALFLLTKVVPNSGQLLPTTRIRHGRQWRGYHPRHVADAHQDRSSNMPIQAHKVRLTRGIGREGALYDNRRIVLGGTPLPGAGPDHPLTTTLPARQFLRVTCRLHGAIYSVGLPEICPLPATWRPLVVRRARQRAWPEWPPQSRARHWPQPRAGRCGWPDRRSQSACHGGA